MPTPIADDYVSIRDAMAKLRIKIYYYTPPLHDIKCGCTDSCAVELAIELGKDEVMISAPCKKGYI